MNKLLIGVLALSAMSSATAAPAAEQKQSQAVSTPASTEGGKYHMPPSEADLPKNAFGDMVRKGHAIFVDTQGQVPELVGNGLNCVNCHMDQGRLANAAPLWGAYTMYPAYRKKNDKVNTYAERIQGCFQFSMNGTPPAADSPEMTALTAFSYWLATGAPTGVDLPGRGYPKVPQPEGGYSIERGKQAYADQCAVCHADDGLGQKAGETYAFPPLWGKDSYNWGAGMHRINTAAAFLKANMPLGKGGTLSDQEAWDLAAFINSHERPQDPRLVDGDIEKTRVKFHANDGVNLYGEKVNGVVLGQGTP